MPPLRRFKFVSPGFFEDDGDSADYGAGLHVGRNCIEKRPVAIVSENLAREYWGSPGECAGEACAGEHEG